MGRLQPGARLSHYTIREHISTGGMSEVYKAVDDHLGRIVAIKVLSSALAEDQDARRRFAREAKAASILAHQSICTVYEVGEADNLAFIVMQYIEGETLKDRIAKGPLPIDQALAYAIDILDALDEAHQHGIIHRDIKPSNIIINDRDVAVVLDFGLAKQVPTFGVKDEVTLSQVTREASIIGTTAYLSPEQVGGEPTDARSDLFSFGILFYEMLTGERPFTRTKDVEIMHAILHDEPSSISKIRPDVPLELERIARKALRKGPEDRYRSVNELKFQVINFVREKGIILSGIRTVPDRTKVLPPPGSQGMLKRLLLTHLVAALTLAVVVLGAVGWYVVRVVNKPTVEPAPTLNIVTLTSWKSAYGELGIGGEGAFSPDEKMIAYSSIEAGTRDIWIKQIDGGRPIQVTSGQNDWSPIWSPDGQKIAFASERGNSVGIWTIPMLGGRPDLLKRMEDRRETPLLKLWSKDGQRIYYELGSNLYLLDLATRQTRQITAFDPSNRPPQDFSISPTEDRIAYTDGDRQFDIWILPMQGGTPVRVTDDLEQDRHPVWHPDGRRIIYSSKRGDTFRVMVVDLDSRTKTQVTVEDTDYSVLDIDRGGTRVLCLGSKEEADIWKVEVLTRKELQVTAEVGVEVWPDVSPDGLALAFQSKDETGGVGKILSSKIMTKQLAARGQLSQIADDGYDPRWSPDGKRIAFLRGQGEQRNIWIVNAAGGDERQLTKDGVVMAGISFLPYNRFESNVFSWAANGRAIAYISENAGRTNVWIVSPDGSGERQVSENQDSEIRYHNPIWSPDMKYIAVVSRSRQKAGGWGVGVINVEAKTFENLMTVGAPIRLTGWSRSGNEVIAAFPETGSDSPSTPGDVRVVLIPIRRGPVRTIARIRSVYLSNIRLSPDERSLALVFRQNGRDNIGVVSVSSGEVRSITGNADPRMYISSLTWSSDGRVIYFGKQTGSRLISMIENFK
jgi:Tol biopolymer transport system component/predicted Ser/Thr protein kinase